MAKTFKSNVASGLKPSGIDNLIPSTPPPTTSIDATQPASKESTTKNVNFSIESDLHLRLKRVSVDRGIPMKDLFMTAIRMLLKQMEEKEK